MSFNVTGNELGSLFGLLVVVAGIFTMLFWMYVGWHAMRAHERIADALARLSDARSGGETPAHWSP